MLPNTDRHGRYSEPFSSTDYSPVRDGVQPLPLTTAATDQPQICIKTSEAMIPYLMTAWELYRYENVIQGDSDQIRHTHNQLKTLLAQIMTADVCETCKETKNNCTCFAIEYVDDIESEDDCMCRLRIETNGENAYLVEDCGCGTTRRYLLTPVSVDPDSGAIGSPIDIIAPGTPLPDATSVEDCYYDKAVDLILNRLADFAGSVFAFPLVGMVAFSPLAEVVEVAQLLDGASKGEFNLEAQNLGYTVNEAKQAILSQTTRDIIKERMQKRNLSGQLSRWNILRLFYLLPAEAYIPTPWAHIADLWRYFVKLSKLNADLALAANECQSGYTFPTSNTNALPISISDGESYWLSQEYTWADSFFSPNTSDFHDYNVFTGLFPGAIGLFADITVESSGNGNLSPISDGDSLWSPGNFLDVAGVSQTSKRFWGASGNESLWVNGGYPYSGAFDTAAIATGTYKVRAETSGNNVDVTWSIKLRFLVDSSVQPFTGSFL